MIAEAKRLEEGVLYSEKGHFSIANVWKRVHYGLGIPGTILAAAAGVSALTENEVLAGGLAIVAAVLTALITFLEPDKTAARHHNAGIKYNAIRGKIRRMRNIDLADGKYSTELRAQLEALAEEKATVTQEAPHLGRLAYRLGKRSIQRKEHAYSVDAKTP